MKVTKIFGPPGTGKTTTLLRTLDTELKNGVRPDRIAYLTFTVQARRVAVERTMDQFGYTRDDLPYFRTLHSIAYRELGVSPTQLLRGGSGLEEFAKETGYAFSQFSSRMESMLAQAPRKALGDHLLAFDSFRRHNLQTVEESRRDWPFEDHVHAPSIRAFTRDYQVWKDREGVVDFTDLLEAPHEPLPVDVVIVDEAQDLSRLQWRALWELAADAERVYIAGDDDQAIFRWAGADPDAFLGVGADEVRILDQSYRLSQSVHQEALDLTHRIQKRQEKVWAPREERGAVRRALDASMALRLLDRTEGSWLILYRNHYLGRPVEAELRQMGVAYGRHDRQAPGAEWARAIHLWEHLRKGNRSSKDQVQTVLEALANREALDTHQTASSDRPYTRETLEREYGVEVQDPWYQALHRIPHQERQYLRAVVRNEGTQALVDTPRVRLSTIHGAKGGEADHVLLLTDMSRRVRQTLKTSPDDELRVWYVGVTRARRTLTIAGPSTQVFR